MNVEDQQRDDDGEDAVAECFDKARLPTVSVRMSLQTKLTGH